MKEEERGQLKKSNMNVESTTNSNKKPWRKSTIYTPLTDTHVLNKEKNLY